QGARDEAQASDCEYHFGSGISGCVGGREVVVGNRELLARRGYAIAASVEEQLAAIAARGQSPLLVGIDGAVAGVAAIGDTLRAEAPGIVERFQLRGWDVRILSGDHEPIVQQIGRSLGLADEKCLGGVSPEEKLGWIRRYQASGKPVIMVGDGVNDAAALAAADVGIAVRGGAEASLQAADVYLASGSLGGIEEIMDTSARTLRIIRRNSRTSLLYNISSVTLAAIGWLHPLAAALLMPASSLTVVSITLWGYTGGSKKIDRTQGALS
ncbi:MAG: HAD-IC family P-type ATPase, partial [Aureliella sp.]